MLQYDDVQFVFFVLVEQKYIVPGLGDFGDRLVFVIHDSGLSSEYSNNIIRYFGTEEDQHGKRTYTYH